MISVVITTCCRMAHVVERAVKSVVNQTLSDWELIVIDDSPYDWEGRESVKNLLNEYESKYENISYIQTEVNEGACNARNIGLAMSKGEYIAYLDDDDEWLDTKLEKQKAKIESNNDLAFVYCGSMYLDERSNKIIKHTEYYASGRLFDRLILKNFVGGTSYPLIRTSVLKEIGGFDNNMQSSQDYDVWLRIAYKYQIDCVSECLVIYHLHPGEQISKSPDKLIQGKRRLIEKFKLYFGNHKRELSIRTVDLAVAYAIGAYYRLALNEWIKGIKLYSAEVKNYFVFLKIVKWFIINNLKRIKDDRKNF